jgi:hypothetical protein
MKKKFFLLILSLFLSQFGLIFSQNVTVQDVAGGVLIFNKTNEPISFSIGFEAVPSVAVAVKPGENNYYAPATPGRAFINGILDASGKFFTVKMYLRDGMEVTNPIKYLKGRPGQFAAGAIQYELTKENNQYVLREKQPGLPPRPMPQLGGHDPALSEKGPVPSTPYPAPIRPKGGAVPEISTEYPKLSE